MKLSSKALKLDSIGKKPEILGEFNILPNTINNKNFKRIRINNDENISSLFTLRGEEVNMDTYIAANYIIQEIEKIYSLKGEEYMNLSVREASNEVIKKLKKSLNWWEKSLYKSIKIYELERRIYNLQKDSLTDSLTGLANRKLIEKELEKACNNKNREGTYTSTIMIDIDYFKKINDTYGHQVGDKALIEISKIFKNNLRSRDIIGRWGGEEFIIILPSTNINEAFKKAEYLRKQIEENLTKNINEKDLDYAVTASFGVSKVNKGDETGHHSIKNADVALYISKNSGRNKVIKEPKKYDTNCTNECVKCKQLNECIFLIKDIK